MKRFTGIFAFAISLFYFSCSPPKHNAVFIIIDGVPADVLENTSTPTIDEIVSAGGYTQVYVGGEKGKESESPTISSPGYMHLLTGTWSNKHNVWDNDIADPNYDYKNIFRIVEESDSSLKTAIFSTWLDNRTKLIGEGLPEAGNIRLDYSFDGFEYDTVNFPHIGRKYISDIDEHVSKEAARYILQEGPVLSWVYLEYTDDIGHMYGDGPEMTEAVKSADAQVGRVWEAVKERMKRTGEEWMVVVTTDHGRSPIDGRDHGGQSERERTTWIVTNISDLNSHFNDNPAIVDIMPSILQFIGIPIPEDTRRYIDGVSFLKE
jgi:predicted AlkP superfamily pyrophosphatase or phosphodiesterase